MNQRPSSGYESTALSRRRSAERSKTRRVPHTSDCTSHTWCRKYVKCENALQKGERQDLTPFNTPPTSCERDICEMWKRSVKMIRRKTGWAFYSIPPTPGLGVNGVKMWKWFKCLKRYCKMFRIFCVMFEIILWKCFFKTYPGYWCLQLQLLLSRDFRQHRRTWLQKTQFCDKFWLQQIPNFVTWMQQKHSLWLMMHTSSTCPAYTGGPGWDLEVGAVEQVWW